MTEPRRSRKVVLSGPPDYQQEELKLPHIPSLRVRSKKRLRVENTLPTNTLSGSLSREISSSSTCDKLPAASQPSSLSATPILNILQEVPLDEATAPIPYSLADPTDNPFLSPSLQRLLKPQMSSKVESKSLQSSEESSEEQLAPIIIFSPLDKLVYTAEEIVECRKHDLSWVKPLGLVKVWRRFVLLNSELDVSSNCRLWCKEAYQFPVHQQPQETLRTVEKEVRQLLNKITESNFESLIVRIIELATQSREFAELIAVHVHRKVCYEHKYTKVYTEISYAVINLYETEKNNRYRRNFFTDLLVKLIDETFSCDDTEIEPAKQKVKLKGNIRFLSELYYSNIVSSEEVVAYLEGFLGYSLSHKHRTRQVTDDHVELAIFILRLVGQKMAKQSTWQCEALLNVLQELVEEQRVGKRVELLAKNLSSLRANGWEKSELLFY